MSRDMFAEQICYQHGVKTSPLFVGLSPLSNPFHGRRATSQLEHHTREVEVSDTYLTEVLWSTETPWRSRRSRLGQQEVS